MTQQLEKRGLTNIERILEGLSPEKRILLEKKLKEEGSKFGVFPLSYAQQRLWFIEQLQPGNIAYNIPTAIKLEGNLDINSLHKSLLQIVKRHEILRTYIYTIDETPMQIVEKQLDVEINKINLSDKISNKDIKIREILENEITKPFHLSELPLFRITLIELSNNEHILILVMHHIISDGWSAGVFINELSQLYSAYSKGQDFELPPLEIQYADFAKWQKQWLQGEVKEKQLQYWKEQLQDINVLQLPTDFNRPKQLSLKGAVVKGEITKNVAEKFSEISKENGTTLFMSLLAVFNILLYKYSGQKNFAIGTPVANRNKKQLESLIGFFVNTLAIKANIEPEISFTNYLKKFKDTILSVFANQDLPFEMIIEELQPERDMSHTPVFQVMFTFQNKSGAKLNLTDIELSQIEFDSTMSKFDITFIIGEMSNGNLSVTFEYNTTLFKAETIQRMVGHYKKIIEEIINNSSIKIDDISIITASEREQIVNEFNTYKKVKELNKPLHALIEEKVKENTESIALTIEGKHFTYSQLNNSANKIARQLLSRERGSEERLIGIYIERSAEMIATILGILKAGYGYLPIDPVYPKERMMFMLEDAKVKCVITQVKLKEKLPETIKEVIEIDNRIFNEEKEYPNIEKDIQPEDLAYCIYTSGSTGKPKGTLITHKNVIRLFKSTDTLFGFNNKDVWSMFHSFAFDFSVWEIFGALLYGGRLVIVPYITSRTPEEFYKLLEDEEITVLNQTPSAFRQLIEVDKTREIGVRSLRYIIFGGEALELSTLQPWINKHGDNKPSLINMYGITETTVHVTYRKISKKDVEENRGSVIGKAIEDLQVYIMDNGLNILPIGIPGEIYVGGDGLAIGYLNRESLTKEKFIKNPIGQGRLYRSGDLAKYDEKGELEYLGRIDNQVKIRGFRIELGEIKSLLNSHKSIKEAEVILYGENIQEKIIIAYFVVEGNEEITIEEIRNYLTQFIPDYMIPTRFVEIEAFPLTPNGKIDYKALPEPSIALDSDNKKIIEPTTDVEKALVEIVKELLQIKNVSITDNFFLIGGHSLLATQLLLRLKKNLSIDIPLKYIFEKPVLKEFAKLIDENIQTKNKSEDIEIEKVSRNKTLPLSYQQQRLWFLDQLDPLNSSYNIPVALKIKGDVDISYIQKAIDEIITRHEILRSYVETINGKPQIKFANSFSYNIELKIISEEEQNKFSKEIFSKPFVLNEYPLFRIKLLKIKDDEYLLLFVIHHIIFDGWSGGIFIKEFIELYSSFQNNRTANLPTLNIQYADFAKWQREYLEVSVFENQLKFWKNYLANVPPLLNLPLDKPRPAIQTFNGSSKRFRLPDELSKKIIELSKKENVTPFMILIAAFNVLLSKYSHQNDICVGTPVANRNHHAIEKLIGFFVNTIVIRSQINQNKTITELLNLTKENSLKVFSNQDIPFEKIVDSIDIERSVNHSPVFQVMFTFQNLPPNKVELSDLKLEAIEPESEISKFDMSLTMMETDNSVLVGNWEYNTDLFLPQTIERMIEHFGIILNDFVSFPKKTLREINIVTEDEKETLINKWNSTEKTIIEKTLPQMFKEAVEKYPDNIAVNYNGQTLTYKELDEESDKLASHLIAENVKPDSLVGFYLERSVQNIISILGIWKCGAAYVPLDIAYPSDRIEYMIKDSGLTNIVTLSKYKNKLPYHINLICLDKLSHENNIHDFTDIKIYPENLAYIIYTSGSTGKPKGVMIKHKSVQNLSEELGRKIYSKKGNMKVSLNAPLAFDASVQQLVALFYGHSLIIVPQDVRLDGEGLMNFIRQNNLDVFDCVPTQLKVLLENGFNKPDENRPAFVLPGGEPIDNKMWELLNKIEDVKFFNMYGPTECTVDSTICEINSNIKVPSIGKPINNVTHFVLDKYLNLLPIGVTGELYIGGKGISRGYLHKPDLTAEKFLPNPFAKKEGELFYKTGDLVKYLPDGNIVYVGRIDTQVKLRGFRIELGEIETLLNSHEDISESVVIIREDRPNVKKLVAYYTSERNEIKNEDLSKYLSENLPEYMVPSFFVKLDEIPLTPNGKINRKELPEPKHINTVTAVEFIKPETDKEIILSEIWKEILGFEKISAKDNFFKLGGDSIVAIQMIAKAKQRGLQITPVQIFQNQTLQNLALVAKEVEVINAEQGTVEGAFPLTPIQKYFFERKFEEPNHWNQSVFLKVNENLDEEKLKESVKYLLLHHDELRTKFKTTDDGIQQINLPFDKDVPFENVDLTMLEPESYNKIIEEKNKEYQASLNISEGKVFNVVLYKLSNNDFRILIIVHHLVIDGVSWRILIEDLLTAYNTLLQNKEVVLPPKTTSYKAWSEFINQYKNSNELLKENEYWLNLTTQEIIPLEKDFDNEENIEKDVFVKTKTINKEESDYLLTGIHEKYNTQINDILLSALLLAYNKWQGKRKLLIHLEGHGREELSPTIDVSRTVGWFTALYPVILSMGDAVEIGDVIKTVKENLRNIPAKGIGFGILRYLTDDKNLKENLSKFDDVQIMFNYLGQFTQTVPGNTPFEMAKEKKGEERNIKNKRNSLLEITAIVAKGEMTLSISANKKQFKEESIKEFINDYHNSLLDIIKHCKGNDNVEYTSSDFDLIDLEDDQLSSVLNKLNSEDD